MNTYRFFWKRLLLGVPMVITLLHAQSAACQEHDRLQTIQPKVAEHLSELRQEALQGNRLQLPEMLEILRQVIPPIRTNAINELTALRACIHLKAPEAIPAIEKVHHANQFPKTYVACLERVAEARIQAETEIEQEQHSAAVGGADLALRKIDRMVALLGLTRAQLAAGIQAHYKAVEAWKHSGELDTEPDWNVEMVAGQEIADLLYRQPGITVATVQSLKDLDLFDDYPAALKLQLAPLSRAQRIAWLIDYLAHNPNIIHIKTDFAVQLAVDEGPDAAAAAAAELKVMNANRAKYKATAYNNFRPLFHIIDGVGDKSHAPLIRAFMADKEVMISNFASPYGGAFRGTKHQFAPEY